MELVLCHCAGEMSLRCPHVCLEWRVLALSLADREEEDGGLLARRQEQVGECRQCGARGLGCLDGCAGSGGHRALRLQNARRRVSWRCGGVTGHHSDSVQHSLLTRSLLFPIVADRLGRKEEPMGGRQRAGGGGAWEPGRLLCPAEALLLETSVRRVWGLCLRACV